MPKFRPIVPTPPERLNPFAKFGLEDNPFPPEPTIAPGSPDPRLRGDIFDPQVRPQRIREFEERFIRVDFSRLHRSIGYLWSLGAHDVTRGMGKSALLIYFKQHINHDYGDVFFGGTQRVCAIYIYPSPGTRHFFQVAALAVMQTNEEGILLDALRFLHYRALSEGRAGLDPAVVADIQTDKEFEQLSEMAWLGSRGINMFSLTAAVRDMLIENGMAESHANDFATRTHSVAEFRSYLNTFSQSKWRQMASDMLCNQVVAMLRAAGFNGAYLFIDELENVVLSQSKKDREVFAKDLRAWLVDGMLSQAAQQGFFVTVLTIHARVQTEMLPAWDVSGLEQIAPSNRMSDPSHSVTLAELEPEECRRLLNAYLKYYRLAETDYPALFPFTDEAVDKMSVHATHHPRQLLKLAHGVLEKAVNDDTIEGQIDGDYIDAYLDSLATATAVEADEDAIARMALGLS